MTEAPQATVYDFTAQQAEVVRLADRYRRCLMDQKYYARRLSMYQRWDTGTNLFAGAAMLLSLAREMLPVCCQTDHMQLG